MSKRFALFLAWDTPILAAMDAAPLLGFANVTACAAVKIEQAAENPSF